MKKFPTLLLISVLFILILSGCMATKQQEAFNRCVTDLNVGFEAIVVVGVLDTMPEDQWPLNCQRWNVLVRIEGLEQALELERSELERLDDAIDDVNKAVEAANATATAAARPTFTNTPPPTSTLDLSPTPEITATLVP